MIDARDYPDKESLARAMNDEYRTIVSETISARYKSLKLDIDQIMALTSYSFEKEFANLNKNVIYWTADQIEFLAKRIVLTASLIKSACRLITFDKD